MCVPPQNVLYPNCTHLSLRVLQLCPTTTVLMSTLRELLVLDRYLFFPPGDVSDVCGTQQSGFRREANGQCWTEFAFRMTAALTAVAGRHPSSVGVVRTRKTAVNAVVETRFWRLWYGWRVPACCRVSWFCGRHLRWLAASSSCKRGHLRCCFE